MELAVLKESLRKLAPNAVPAQRTHETRATGLGELDALLAGGLPRGGICEFSGEASSGKTALSLSIAARCTTKGELVAYLNARGELYPPTAAALGVDLARLLVVSFSRSDALAIDLARATEILIRCRHIPLIIIDLPETRALAPARAQRLRQVAHAVGTSLVTLSDRKGATIGASVRIQVWPHQQKRDLDSPRRIELHLEKGGHNPGGRVVLELPSYRVDHAPPRAMRAPLQRTAPGAAPKPPPRSRKRGVA